MSPQKPTGSGQLDDIPFGAKDIIETRGLSTEYGSPIYKGRIGNADAAIVREMRRRGAVLLGKTHTTAFAYRTPAPHAIPEISSTRRAEARAARPPRSPPAWCQSRSERKPADRCCGRRPIAASPPRVEPAMAAGFSNALTVLRRAGASIRPTDIAGMLDKLADLVRDGLQISVQRYDEARRYIADCKVRVAELYKATPVILAPSATGPAPMGLASTGDARMNRPWTALGTPAISVPMPVAGGLPLGLQLTADHGQDSRLIRTAMRVQHMLGS